MELQPAKLVESLPAKVEDDAPAPYWKCVVAAAPQLLVGLQLLLAHWDIRFLGVSDADLTAAVAIEALMIYVALVVLLSVIFLPTGIPFMRALRNYQIGLVFVVTALLSFAFGVAAALQFIAMTVITYLGLFMSWKQPSVRLQFVSRWLVAYAALALAVSMFHTPENLAKWRGELSVLDAGTLYFFLIGAVELAGVHLRTVPRYRVRILTFLYGIVGKTYP